MIHFRVTGRPVPQGSKRGIIPRRKGGAMVTRPDGRPLVTISDMGGQRLKKWRQAIAARARQVWPGQMLDGPIALRVVFAMARPRKHYIGKSDRLRADAPHWHTSRPDSAKLRRAVEDALSGVLWPDDSHVVKALELKRYAAPGEEPGVEVTIQPLKSESQP